jgi:hypothetical protein
MDKNKGSTNPVWDKQEQKKAELKFFFVFTDGRDAGHGV